MIGDLSSPGPSPEILDGWIVVSGENDLVDAKGPVSWDRADVSASLAKDIAAFANSRDGGVIVIGKSESKDGNFVYNGVTSEEAASFDTTRVAQWVNAHFSPSIHFTCYQHKFQGKRFVVIVVQEFDDIPTVCTKSFEHNNKPKKAIIKEGEIYVRTANAESKPLRTADELRAVIGLATKKRGDELIAHLGAMIKGQSLLNLGPAPDPFEEEVHQVMEDLRYTDEKGGWWMSFHPHQYTAERWATTEELERLISAHSVRAYHEFPGNVRGTVPMGWGVANEHYGETWALTKSGLFCFWKEFEENRELAEQTCYRGGEAARRPIQPGEWIEYTWSISTVVKWFMFLSRFTVAYGAGEDVHINVKVGPLVGRKLVALSQRIFLGYGEPEPARARYFTYDKVLDVETLHANWKPVCAEVLKQLFELFPEHRISEETLLKWIARYETKQF